MTVEIVREVDFSSSLWLVQPLPYFPAPIQFKLASVPQRFFVMKGYNLEINHQAKIEKLSKNILLSRLFRNRFSLISPI